MSRDHLIQKATLCNRVQFLEPLLKRVTKFMLTLMDGVAHGCPLWGLLPPLLPDVGVTANEMSLCQYLSVDPCQLVGVSSPAVYISSESPACGIDIVAFSGALNTYLDM